LAENASFDVLIDKIRPSVFAVGEDKKKRKGKGRKGKGSEGTQSHKTLYFSYLRSGHPLADFHKIWQACCPSNLINVSNFCNKIFRGFRSTLQGSNSPFSHCLCWSSLQQCCAVCATAQPVILHVAIQTHVKEEIYLNNPS